MREKLNHLCRVVGFLLLILAGATLYVCLRELPNLPSVEGYRDQGVYTFAPYRVLPHQQQNNSTGRTQRTNPTKTVYMVYYREVNGAGYRWLRQTGSKDSGNRILEQGERVQRRVLSLVEQGTYITIDPELSAEDYVTGWRQKYLGALWLSVGYLVFYPLAWGLVLVAQKQRRDRERSWEN